MRLARLLIAAAFAAGLAFRLFQYAGGRSLWLDEVALAAALQERSFADVVKPGPWHAVPPGFMLLARLFMVVLGSSEYALRLLPLLSGIAALALFAVLARRWFGGTGAAIAVAVFAVAPYPVYYASELKQYSTDLAVTVALLLWGLKLLAAPLTARRATALAAAGVVCTLLSFTSVFVLGGIGLLLGISALRGRRWREVRLLAAVAAVWVVALVIPGILLLQRVGASDGYLASFWEAGFPPLPPRSLSEALWLPAALVRLFREPLGMLEYRATWLNFVQIGAGAMTAAAGAVFLWRRDRGRAGLLLLPVAVTLVASAVRAYPFGGAPATSGRVLIFLIPPLVLLMAEGITPLWTRAGAARVAGALLLVAAAGPSLAENAARIPYGRSEVRPLLGYLEENARPGDLLYVHYDVQPAFRFYRPRYRLDGVEPRMGPCSRLEPGAYLDALQELRGHPRVWVLFAGGTGSYGFLESKLMVDFLDHFGTRLDDRVATGTSLFLFDLGEKASPPAPYQITIPNFPPGTVNDCPFFENISALLAS